MEMDKNKKSYYVRFFILNQDHLFYAIYLHTFISNIFYRTYELDKIKSKSAKIRLKNRKKQKGNEQKSE